MMMRVPLLQQRNVQGEAKRDECDFRTEVRLITWLNNFKVGSSYQDLLEHKTIFTTRQTKSHTGVVSPVDLFLHAQRSVTALTSALETRPCCLFLLVVVMTSLLSPICHGGIVFCI
jgi:hypothetical protein